MPELGLPDLASPAPLVEGLCHGRRSFSDLRRIDLAGPILGLLTWRQRKELDRLAPERVRVPSGRELRLRYEPEGPPILAARVQQLFGLTETPRVAQGRVPVVVHLLAPSGRPVQVTQDLASFWRNTYPEVRRELRGRYPKHAWPEDPFS